MYNVITGVSILMLILCSCSDSKKNTQQEAKTTSPQVKVTEETVGTITEEATIQNIHLSQILEGQWKSERTEAVSVHWREFDTSKNIFYSWADDEQRPSKPAGVYKIFGDTAIQLSFSDYNEIVKFGLDSISLNYLDMWSYGVSAGNLIYKRSAYKQNVFTDTITVKGKIIKTYDPGLPFTIGLNVDTNTDTLHFLYATEEYFESTLINKNVTIRYVKFIQCREGGNGDLSITGMVKVLDYGGDFHCMYSITNKNGRSIKFETYIEEQHKAMDGKETTIDYYEHHQSNIISLTVREEEKPIMNTLVFGDWNVVTSDSIVQGSRQIKIRPGDENGVYIDFGQGSNYVKSDIYSNSIVGTNSSGEFKLELISEDPAIFDYSDDGMGGHFDPIKNQKYNKPTSEFRDLLIGKWQGVKDTEGNVEFTDKVFIMGDSRMPYVLSNICMDDDMQERFSHLSTGKVVYISTILDGGADLSYKILNLDEVNLSYVYLGTANDFYFKKVK